MHTGKSYFLIHGFQRAILEMLEMRVKEYTGCLSVYCSVLCKKEIKRSDSTLIGVSLLLQCEYPGKKDSVLSGTGKLKHMEIPLATF